MVDATASQSEEARNPLLRLRGLLAAEGGGALLAGLAPRCLRALCSGAIQFASYEFAQEVFTNK